MLLISVLVLDDLALVADAVTLWFRFRVAFFVLRFFFVFSCSFCSALPPAIPSSFLGAVHPPSFPPSLLPSTTLFVGVCASTSRLPNGASHAVERVNHAPRHLLTSSPQLPHRTSGSCTSVHSRLTRPSGHSTHFYAWTPRNDVTRHRHQSDFIRRTAAALPHSAAEAAAAAAALLLLRRVSRHQRQQQREVNDRQWLGGSEWQLDTRPRQIHTRSVACHTRSPVRSLTSLCFALRFAVRSFVRSFVIVRWLRSSSFVIVPSFVRRRSFGRCRCRCRSVV